MALSFVCVSPLVIITAINSVVQTPVLFFVSLVLYALVFLLGGAKFERWRTNRILGASVTTPRVPRRGRTFLYALINIVVGGASVLVLFGWLMLIVRNVVLYPLPGVGEWGHPYPDTSWGGPTWQGAIALHAGGALLSLLIFPWVMRRLAIMQSALVRRFLGDSLANAGAGTAVDHYQRVR